MGAHLRVGIVGAGPMALLRAAAWTRADVPICAVYSPYAAEIDTLALTYGALLCHRLEDLLKQVDIVDVAVHAHQRREIVMAASNAGRHILCEQPIADSPEATHNMMLIGQNNGARLMLAHFGRLCPEYVHAQQTIASGDLGQPTVIRLSRLTYAHHGNHHSGRIMRDLMVHDFDYARWIAGDVRQVYARTLNLKHTTTGREHAIAILVHRSGALSHIMGSWAYPSPTYRTSFEIAAQNGMIQHDSDCTRPVRLYSDQQTQKPVASEAVVVELWRRQVALFYDAVRTGNPFPVSPADAQAALQIALAAEQSAANGRPIAIGDTL